MGVIACGHHTKFGVNGRDRKLGGVDREDLQQTYP